MRRLKYFLTGVLIPGICIVAGLTGVNATLDSPWQSGSVSDYVCMLLRGPALAVFLPLILYSAGCLTWWLLAQDGARRFSIRLGIYTGVILAVQFVIFMALTTGTASLFFAAILAPVLAIIVFVGKYTVLRARRFTIAHLIIFTTLVAILVFVFLQLDTQSQDVAGFILGLYCVIGAGPTLNCVSYVRASIEVARHTTNHDPISARRFLVCWFVWLAAWAASWRFAVDLLLIEYAKLPTTDPNCYVSSAAAHGHPRLVGVSDLPRAGSVANMQMRRLKFLEFAFAAAAPAAHTAVRRVYNRCGPSLARVCGRNVWFADVSYLLLKPLEIAAVLIRGAARIPPSRIRDIYD